MRTINIPLSKLIKFIPSEPDGGKIPGAVISASVVSLKKISACRFELRYRAESKLTIAEVTCGLDEELDVIPDSNESKLSWYSTLPQSPSPHPLLIDDGVLFRLVPGATEAKWTDFRELEIPDPFDKVGLHGLSDFARWGGGHMASLCKGNALRLAISTKHGHLMSDVILYAGSSPVNATQPCQHGNDWLLPWSCHRDGINITSLSEQEMEGFIAGAERI